MNNKNLKLTLLGESTTGKSTIVSRLLTNKFNESTGSTIGASFSSWKIDDVKYEIWDTAGQERYLSLTSIYYRNSNLFLLVFDVNDLTSLARIDYFMEKLNNDVPYEHKIIVVGNKIDLISSQDITRVHEISIEKLKKYDIENMDFIFVSSKTGENFGNLVDLVKKRGKYLHEKCQKEIKSNSIQLHAAIEAKKRIESENGSFLQNYKCC